MIGEINPYVGPKPFETSKYFYGRDRESRDLVDLLIAERIVLLYSPSGAGKTSLIQAAVIGQMKAEDYQVLPVVRPGAGINASKETHIFNRFVERVIRSCEDGRPEKEPPLAGVPGITLGSYFSQRSWIQTDARLKLIILDQFEEVLTSGEEEETKVAFFQQLGEALRDQRIWALFAMREEYSAALDSYRHLMPTRLGNRFRLNLLGHSEACQAIRKPALDEGVEIQEEALQSLIKALGTVQERRGDGLLRVRQVPFIEPLYLQIVCQKLWDRLPQDTRRIAPEHLGLRDKREGADAAISEVEQALEQYYADQVRKVSVQTGADDRRIREWLEWELLTPQGLRRQVPKGEQETAGLANPVVEALAEHFLLRSDIRVGTFWYEVAHDRLAAVIVADNAQWFVQHLKPFQLSAGQWDLLRRAGAEEAAQRKLLRGNDLRQAERFRSQRQGGLSRVDMEFLIQSRAAWLRGRRERWMKFALAVLPVLIVIAAVFSWAYFERQAKELERQAKEFEKQAKEKVLATALLSASATEKWRNHNPERASLLAIQAYRFANKHSNTELDSKAEEMLRTALQSQPFAYETRLPEGQKRMGESAILSSRGFGMIAERTGDRSLRLVSLKRPIEYIRNITTQGKVVSAAFAPEDRHLAVLTEDGLELHPIAPATGTERLAEPQTLAIGARPLGAFCFSSDGRRVAIALESGQIEFWELESGSPARPTHLETRRPAIPEGIKITALVYLYGSRWAWGTRSGDVGMVDLESPDLASPWISGNHFADWPEDLRKTLDYRKDTIDFGVASLHYLSQRDWLLAVYHNGPPRIYDLGGIGPSPSGTYLVPNMKSEAAMWIDQDRGLATRRVVSLARFVTGDASPDGQQLAVGGTRGLVGLWDLASVSSAPDKDLPVQRISDGKPIFADYQEIPGLGGKVQTIRFARPAGTIANTEKTSSERWLAAADVRGKVRWWFLAGLRSAGYRSFQPGAQPGMQNPDVFYSPAFLASPKKDDVLYALAFLASPENDGAELYLAFGGTKASGVLGIDSQNLEPKDCGSFDLPVRIRALATGAGRRRVVIATGNVDHPRWPKDQYSWLLDLTNGMSGRAMPLPGDTHTDGQWAALTNKDGTFLLTAGWDGAAIIWRQKDGQWQTEVLVAASKAPNHESALISAALDPQGRDLVLGSFGGKVRLWRNDGSGLLEQAPLLDGSIPIPIRALAYSPDGKHLVAGDDNGYLQVWNISAGGYDTKEPIPAHKGTIYSVAFGDDGRLVTGGSDGLVYVWEKGGFDPSRRKRLEGPTSEVVSAVLAPTDDLVAASDADGHIHLWQLGLPELVKRACAWIGGNLSWQEWSTYVGTEGYECTCPGLLPGTEVPPNKLAQDHGCAGLPSNPIR